MVFTLINPHTHTHTNTTGCKRARARTHTHTRARARVPSPPGLQYFLVSLCKLLFSRGRESISRRWTDTQNPSVCRGKTTFELGLGYRPISQACSWVPASVPERGVCARGQCVSPGPAARQTGVSTARRPGGEVLSVALSAVCFLAVM